MKAFIYSWLLAVTLALPGGIACGSSDSAATAGSAAAGGGGSSTASTSAGDGCGAGKFACDSLCCLHHEEYCDEDVTSPGGTPTMTSCVSYEEGTACSNGVFNCNCAVISSGFTCFQTDDGDFILTKQE